jgi:hypothetical protein
LPGFDPAIHAAYRHAKVGAIIRDVSSNERKLTMGHRVKPGGDERIAGSPDKRSDIREHASHPRVSDPTRRILLRGPWKRRPHRQPHFALAAAASVDPNSRIAALGKHFDGRDVHVFSALTRGTLGAAGFQQTFKHFLTMLCAG